MDPISVIVFYWKKVPMEGKRISVEKQTSPHCVRLLDIWSLNVDQNLGGKDVFISKLIPKIQGDWTIRINVGTKLTILCKKRKFVKYLYDELKKVSKFYKRVAFYTVCECYFESLDF